MAETNLVPYCHPTVLEEVAPDTFVDLDEPVDPGGGAPPYDKDLSLSFPYAMAFGGPNDLTAIGGSTADLVGFYDAGGDRTGQIDLRTAGTVGRVPRSLEWVGSDLYVYCQQSGNILRWPIPSGVPASGPSLTFSLGNDPTDEKVASGREIFYDGRLSLDGRTTCATCHPGGESDALIWDLKDGAVDFKDPMVTQTLKGLQDTAPLHWRGERDLDDFNGAFPELLGTANELSPADLSDFDAFIHSLRPPANPRQDWSRKVKDELVQYDQPNGIVGHPEDGLTLYRDVGPVTVPATPQCVSCHPFPTGGNGVFQPDNVSGVAWDANIETVQLSNALELRRQPSVTFAVTNGGMVTRPLLGAGYRHLGSRVDLVEFLELEFSGYQTDQSFADVAAFMDLYDTGTAPSTHLAVHIKQGRDSVADLKERLVDPADDQAIDIVGIGFARVAGGGSVRLSWYYDRNLGQFVPDQPSSSVGNTTWQEFDDYFQGTDPGPTDTVFFGVPYGHGRRLGHDYDGDETTTAEEFTAGTNPWVADPIAANPGSPTLTEGVEVSFANAGVIKIHFETSEPCQWTIDLTTPGATDSEGGTDLVHFLASQDSYTRVHTAVINRIKPSGFGPAGSGSSGTGGSGQATGAEYSTQYTGILRLKARDGDQHALLIDSSDQLIAGSVSKGTMNSMVQQENTVSVGKLVFDPVSRPATQGQPFAGVVKLRVNHFDRPTTAPAVDFYVVGKVWKRAADHDEWIEVSSNDLVHYGIDSDFQVQANNGTTWTGSPSPYEILGPPFVVLAKTDGAGEASSLIRVSNIDLNDQIAFSVVAIFPEPAPAQPSTGPFTFELGDIPSYFMAATPSELRTVISKP